jgi:ABC-type sugar transport system ATPase subunit
MDIADTITVLRGGKIVLSAAKSEVTPNTMIEAMIGRKIDSLFPPRDASSRTSDKVLQVKSFSRGKSFREVAFDLHRGEILGFYGLIGAGRTEVMRALSGADDFDRGEIELDGENVHPTSPRSAIQSGIVYLPEDRKMQGLVLQMSGRENIVLPILKRVSRLGIIRRPAIRALTSDVGRQTTVRGNMDQPVSTLSGGNQQKIVIAKGLATDAKVLIFDEPTRGIDVGSKYEIYVLIQQLASRGVGIILVSSELPEIINLSDRAIVMSGGRVSGMFNRDEFDERTLLGAAFAAFRTP